MLSYEKRCGTLWDQWLSFNLGWSPCSSPKSALDGVYTAVVA